MWKWLKSHELENYIQLERERGEALIFIFGHLNNEHLITQHYVGTDRVLTRNQSACHAMEKWG